MRIKWEVDDGYAGKSRPHFLEIDDEELEGLDDDERKEFIDEQVRYAFEDKINYYWQEEG
jgi:hypothetical protein